MPLKGDEQVAMTVDVERAAEPPEFGILHRS